VLPFCVSAARVQTAGVDHFVGRAGELAILEAQMVTVQGGQPRVVVLEGEAGIGKSSLLVRFLSLHPDACVLRASGDEAETLLAWGVADQILAGAKSSGPAGWPEDATLDRAAVGPIGVGAQLVAALGDLQSGDRVVVLVIDDLHWSDLPSAQAVLFALRRMQADRVLALVSARPGELGRLGDGWTRFAGGDHRATRLRIGSLSADDLREMSLALGVGDLSARAAAQLLDHTEGNSLHCRALLEELGSAGLTRAVGDLPAPRALADVVQAHLNALSESARDLVTAAAILGRRSPLGMAAALAGLAEPFGPLDEVVAVGLLVEDRAGPVAEFAFAHPLVHAAVRDSIAPASHRRLQLRAARLLPALQALPHRVAAAVGPDDKLAGDLEEAAHEAVRAGRAAQAAEWLIQASAVSTARPDQERRLLDAVSVLVDAADVTAALALWPAVAVFGPSARRSGLLGHIDHLCGRGSVVEAHLLEAWQGHNPDTEPLVGAVAATSLAHYLCTLRREDEAITWSERAVAASAADPAARLQALTVVALSLALAGRGAEGIARLPSLPALADEAPPELTDGVVMRGMCRLFTDDASGAVADLSVGLARLRAGVGVRYPGYCMAYLAEAEYRIGNWDDVLLHADLAISLAQDTEWAWALAYAHAYAAAVPVARGNWELARFHVEASGAAAAGSGSAIRAAGWARAELAAALGDPGEVMSAAASVRALGRQEAFGLPGSADWRPLEVGALISLGRLQDAEAALGELASVASARGGRLAGLTAARLRGNLAVARGDLAGASDAFTVAWQLAEGLTLPFHLASLELDDGRRLRRTGDRQGAVERFRRAHGRLVALDARPHVAACERELTECGVEVQPTAAPRDWNLTASEMAVARLVSTGRSNREVAAELFVSVKAVEFHLGHVFDKLGVRSRRALPGLLASPAPE
jgi:DNA-binding CsgD family transcriptional regulator/tetratricopeptide (TPR) repeat protein